MEKKIPPLFNVPPKKVGIIIPWFGANLKGGAESHCYQIANHLTVAGCSLEVLTTCSQSFLGDWYNNHYDPGTYIESGIHIKRFSVDPCYHPAFIQTNNYLLKHKKKVTRLSSSLDNEAEANFFRHSINSKSLLEYLEANKDEYSCFIILPYLFGLTVNAARLLTSKAILMPCLHDEPYAYLNEIRKTFYSCGAIMFLSRGEQATAVKIYGSGILNKSFITGGGIEIDTSQIPNLRPLKENGEPITVRPQRYFLCLGRRCEEKNTFFLIKEFMRVLDSLPEDFKIVFAGPGTIPKLWQTTLNDRIIDAGLVDSNTKKYLIKNSRVLINPSINESYSRVLFEAWLLQVPVLIHEQCPATMGTLIDSGYAGYYADDGNLGEKLVQISYESTSTLVELGAKGQIASKKLASWPSTVKRIFGAISCYSYRQEAEEAPKELNWYDLWFQSTKYPPKRHKKTILILDSPDSKSEISQLLKIHKIRHLLFRDQRCPKMRPNFKNLNRLKSGSYLRNWDEIASALVMCEMLIISSFKYQNDWTRLAFHLGLQIAFNRSDPEHILKRIDSCLAKNSIFDYPDSSKITKFIDSMSLQLNLVE